MPVSPARLSAFEILLRIEREDSYATELLHSSQLEKLSSRDHGLATELVMGVLRWRSILDQEVASASSQKSTSFPTRWGRKRGRRPHRASFGGTVFELSGHGKAIAKKDDN